MVLRKSDLASSYEDVGNESSFQSALEDFDPPTKRVSNRRLSTHSISSVDYSGRDARLESSFESLKRVKGSISADSGTASGDTADEEGALASQLATKTHAGRGTVTPTKTRSRKSPTPGPSPRTTSKKKRRIPGAIREQDDYSSSQIDSELPYEDTSRSKIRPPAWSVPDTLLSIFKWLLELLIAPISSALSNFVFLALIVLAAYAIIMHSIPASFHGIVKGVTFIPSSAIPFLSATRHAGGAGRWAWCRTVGWRCSVGGEKKARMVRRVYDSASAANDIFSRYVRSPPLFPLVSCLTACPQCRRPWRPHISRSSPRRVSDAFVCSGFSG
jgi:hypothetical protein